LRKQNPGKQKVDLPAVFENARYVDVEAYDVDASNSRVIPDDRNAIYNVEQGLKDWHRYAVVYERDRADLVFWFARAASPPSLRAWRWYRRPG
jgi:hypothetical protein